jgi:putative hemolysin
MESSSTVGLLIISGLVLLHALISAAHHALVSARKQTLRELAEDGNKRAQRVLDLSEDATRLLTTRQFFSILVHFTIAGVLTLAIDEPLVQSLIANGMMTDTARWIVYPLTILIGAMVVLVFGEFIPTAYASSRAEQIAMLSAGFMRVFMALFAPVSRLMKWISTKIVSPAGKAGYVTEEEIKTLVDAGSEEGTIEDEEKEMIYSIFQFGDKVAREVMIPRIDMVALDVTATIGTALDTVLQSGHSRIPMYEETVDKIVGVLYAKDLLRMMRDPHAKERAVREIMRPAYFVPESKKAGGLLEELQQRKIHIAIVIDEYGGTAGLVTIEDLLEEIVGDIQDEYDPEAEADYVKISDDEYVFDAGIHLGEVNELLDVELPTEESDTLGGFVFSTLGRVPLVGDTLTTEDLEIVVESITGRRIRKVRVRVLQPATPPAVTTQTMPAVEPDEKPADKVTEKPEPVEVETPAKPE